jgi:hypothetical protein
VTPPDSSAAHRTNGHATEHTTNSSRGRERLGVSCCTRLNTVATPILQQAMRLVVRRHVRARRIADVDL